MIEINKNPSKNELAWFGLLFLLFFGIVGGVVAWRFGAMRVSQVLWGAGAVGCVVYYAAPALRRPIYLGWMYAVYPIGWLVSHVLLGLIYYVMFTVIGMIMRLLGRDPMHRTLDPDATTYWIEREPAGKAGEPGRYFRQF